MLLPKGYISWSQKDKWEKNKKEYRENYYFGSEWRETKYSIFGKKYAEEMEAKRGKGAEYKLALKIKNVPILLYMDFYDEEKNHFIDDKTSLTPWTQSKTEAHGQFAFYAVAIRKKFGKIPTCEARWVGTKLNRFGEVTLTGEEKSFYRTFSEKELDEFEKSIVKTAKEISEDYQKEINNL